MQPGLAEMMIIGERHVARFDAELLQGSVPDRPPGQIVIHVFVADQIRCPRPPWSFLRISCRFRCLADYGA